GREERDRANRRIVIIEVVSLVPFERAAWSTVNQITGVKDQRRILCQDSLRNRKLLGVLTVAAVSNSQEIERTRPRRSELHVTAGRDIGAAYGYSIYIIGSGLQARDVRLVLNEIRCEAGFRAAEEATSGRHFTEIHAIGTVFHKPGAGFESRPQDGSAVGSYILEIGITSCRDGGRSRIKREVQCSAAQLQPAQFLSGRNGSYCCEKNAAIHSSSSSSSSSCGAATPLAHKFIRLASVCARPWK